MYGSIYYQWFKSSQTVNGFVLLAWKKVEGVEMVLQWPLLYVSRYY
jgi:hypothetical protein